MYMDSLTITALVIFAVSFGVFVKFCILRICGMPAERADRGMADKDDSSQGGAGS